MSIITIYPYFDGNENLLEELECGLKFSVTDKDLDKFGIGYFYDQVVEAFALEYGIVYKYYTLDDSRHRH